jgi:hypothetical protein
MRRLPAAGLFVVAILLLFAAEAGAVKPQPNKAKQTAEPVWALAIDGPRVAYASGGRIHLWNVLTGTSSTIRGEYSNAAHTVNAAEVAIAGKRIDWIKREQLGNTEMPQRLYAAQVGGSAHRLRRVLGYTNTDCGSGGSQIAGLVRSGTSLAVSTWKWDTHGIVATNRHLNLVTPTGLRPIATGPSAVVSASAGGGHVAVVPLRTASMGADYCEVAPATSIGIYSVSGALLRQIVPGGAFGEVALGGKQLVVQIPSPAPELKVYDWTTGALVHTWPVLGAATRAGPHQSGHVQVRGGLALYSVYSRYVGGGEKLHVLDLATGKDAVVANVKGFGANRAWAIGSRGLVYVVNRGISQHSPGKLVFVPTAELNRLVGH